MMGWSRGHIIGHGSSAMVYLATTSSSPSTTSISAVKSSELSRSEHLRREQKILSSLSSPYIVTYKGYDITTENKTLFYNLFMEYMPLGTLTQFTLRHRHKHGGRINEPVIAHYTRQVLQGLEYLHSRGLVHCDIKGSNILVNEDGAKISDFGCAKYANNNEQPPGAISGTPMFMSPEVARGEEQGYPCDIWALGCTMVEIATGFAPWPNVEDPVSILYHVAYSNEVPQIPCFLSDQAKDFLGKCFMRNSKERWSASQLLKHPFLVEFNSKGKQILESNSCSPTSILDHGFWNSVEESECHLPNNLVGTSCENSAAGRIRGLALRSGDPNWTWDHNNWITTIGNNEPLAEVEPCAYGLFGSETRNYIIIRNHVVSTNNNVTPDNYGYMSFYYCSRLHDPILCNNFSSKPASSTVGGDLDELEKSNAVCSRINNYLCEDYESSDVNVSVGVSTIRSSLNLERGIAKMVLPSTLDFL